MERIQVAIAKARAARNAELAAATPRRAQRGAIHPLPDTATAWNDLQIFTPDSKALENSRINSNAKGAEGAAFDVLRTRIFKLMQANGWKRLAITSPTAGCGKSTIALNLGFNISRPTDMSAILVEIDMRRPSLATKIGLRNRHSVAKVLSGVSTPEQNMVRVGNSRFGLLSNHAPVPNPSDLFQIAEVGHVLKDIETTYAPSVTLFDMPPLLVNDDTIAFLQHVDCVLLVAAAEQTTIAEIDSSEKELAEYTNVIGVTLNMCRFSGRRYGYDYYYS